MKFVGGNISSKIEYWKQITTNRTILDWVANGVSIPFRNLPQVFKVPNRSFNREECNFIRQEIKELERAGCIYEVKQVPEYLSPINVVPKKIGFRFIIDLRKINNCCNVPKCSYEGLDDVIKITEPGDQFITFHMD